jgi:hypothetical protein
MTLKLRTTPIATTKPVQPPEPQDKPSMQNTIQTFTADLADIQKFLSISFSPTRSERVESFLKSALESLPKDFNFDYLRQNDQVDYLLLQSHVKRLLHQSKAEAKKYRDAKNLGLFGEWVDVCIEFVERRHNVGRQSGREIGAGFQSAEQGIDRLVCLLDSEDVFKSGKKRFVLFWTIARFEELKTALEEAVEFYRGYDPVITWWIKKSWDSLMAKLTDLTVALRKLTGIDGASSADDIVGDPIGREALLGEIEAEWIAYTPEKLIQIAEEEFEWCERGMKKASETLGFDSPSDALEHVKNTFVEPGEQIHVSAVLHTQFLIPNSFLVIRWSAISPTKQSPM